MFPQIKAHCDQLIQQFNSIPEDRKALLQTIAGYIRSKRDRQLTTRLMYVCTHNSRRSHFGQVWAAVAADYYDISDIETYSGGTEATAFNPNAIHALQQTGFEIIREDERANPHYTVRFGEQQSTTCFSKVFNAPENPHESFAAIMTCSDADENCPFIPGVELRIGTTYEDPKAFDNTPLQDEKYLERSNQIARECLYVFSLI